MTEDFLKNIPSEDPSVARGAHGGGAPGGGISRTRMAAPSGVTLRDLMRILFKHKWALFIPFVIVSAAGIAFTMQATPWYVATARIQIQPNPLSELLPGGSTVAGKNVLQDQVQLLLSDTMLQKVVEALYLHDRMPALFESELQRGDKISIVINILKDSILDVRVVPDSNFVQIEARWPEKDLAAVIPNTLADLYVAETKDRLAQTASRVKGQYASQAEKTQTEIDKADVEIENFLNQNEITSMEGRREALALEISTNKQRAVEEENNLISLREETAALEEELEKAPAELSAATSVGAHPEYLRLHQLIEDAKLRRVTYLGIWKEDSNVVRRLDRQIQELQADLEQLPSRLVEEATAAGRNPQIDRIQADLTLLRREERAAEARLANHKKRIEEVENQSATVERLNRDYQNLLEEKDILERKLAYERSLAIRSGEKEGFADEISDVLIADRARRPVGPAYPNKPQNALLSVAAGMGIGIALAALRELMNRTLETTDDVQKHLGLPVLGTIRDKAFR